MEETTRPTTENRPEPAAAAKNGPDVKFEGAVSAEQELSATVARRRRNLSKKRAASATRSRELTPARDLPAAGDGHAEDAPPKTPERRQRRKSRAEDALGDAADAADDTKPAENGAENGKPEEAPTGDVEALLTRARSVANARERPSRMKRDKKLLIRRSQSAPREKFNEELVEDFKKAQLNSPEPTVAEKEPEAPVTHPEPGSTENKPNKTELEQKTPTKDDAKLEQKSPKKEEPKKKKEAAPKTKRMTLKEVYGKWKLFTVEYKHEYDKIMSLRNKCLNHLGLLLIFCGLGGIIFKFTEGAFENFYKCGVKRVKRDFIDSLWRSSHNLREEDWKSLARRKLKDFEEQLHTAHEAGVQSYSGQRSWSFLNGIVYALTVVTTIGYGHMYPTTTTGRALTIVYALIGIPLFLIILTDFGKLFTRAIKFVWAFVRRVYYTGSCKKIRKTTGMQEVMKGAHMVYEIATFRRPSHYNIDEENGQDLKNAPNFNIPTPRSRDGEMEPPNTPAPSTFQIDDEFNLPITVAILILILYIFSGAVIYYIWEEWDFFASFYFVFISMSTIGFGDFVPSHPICMIVSIIYLVFGLALMSMCINVVQAKLSDTFRQASAKLGATIGLTVAEEDGSITTVPPPAIEIPDVHQSATSDSLNKSKSDINVDT